MKSRNLAAALNVDVMTVYKWTQVGFIDLLKPSRTGGGHRVFDDRFLEDLRLVRRLQIGGMTAELSFRLVAKHHDIAVKVCDAMSEAD